VSDSAKDYGLLRETKIPGCFEIQCKSVGDERGRFVKTYAASAFTLIGLATPFAECFYSVSKVRVLRGMHFQLPPADHAKLVYCLSGAVLDIALDLRCDSPAFQQAESFLLDEESARAVYLPKGLAHGFYVLQGPALMMYHVTAEYDPALDAGLCWDSFDFQWLDPKPIVSERDRNLPAMHAGDFGFTMPSFPCA
jgi:dTDP-4-dehydrorhamnose 3,5-epimerase